MKRLVKFALATTVALSIGASVRADLSVYYTGSTAMRSTFYNAIADKIGVADQGGSSSGQMTWEGKSWDGTTVNIYANFTGSAQGIQDLIQGNLLNYLDHTGATFTHAPTAALSDVYQASTPFSTSFGFSDISSWDFTGNPGHAGIGCLVFMFAGNKAALDLGINNMSAENFRNLAATGKETAGFFGSSTPATQVYLTGRNNKSGTRITTLAVTGYGIFKGVQQWAAGVVNDDGTGKYARGGDIAAPPVAFAPNANYVGGEGWDSGGGVAGDLSNNNMNAGDAYPMVSYVGVSDANTIGNGGGVIKYDGYAYTTANLANGAYTFWCYEHLYSKPGTDADTFKTSLNTAVQAREVTDYGAPPAPLGVPSVVPLSAPYLKVSRSGDGSLVH